MKEYAIRLSGSRYCADATQVLGIALTDTFGTPAFFRAFKQSAPSVTTLPRRGIPSGSSAAKSMTAADTKGLIDTEPTLSTPTNNSRQVPAGRSYAHIFTGIRQDSGDPLEYVKTARDFYDSVGIVDKKVVVFSDSLNIERCLEYKQVAEDLGFMPSFGVGTFLTNDFVHKSDGRKSVPLNIVIKLSHAAGRPAIKISDNIGKNTGDSKTVQAVKKRLGYHEHTWRDGDEAVRWGREGQ